MLVAMIFFAAVLAFAGTLIVHTVTANGAAIVRALRMEVAPEWQPVPPAARTVRVRRVARPRMMTAPQWRAAA